MNTGTLIAVVIAIVAVAVVVWAIFRLERTKRLRSKFGPEYDRAVTDSRDRNRAEAELVKREDRVKRFKIRQLSAEERTRFADSWKREQSLFVDDPKSAVINADTLVTELMSARGYPMSDFQTQAADISVDHPRVVDNYREGHSLAERCRRGQASTEELRRAMIHYRALFEDLLGSPVVDYQREEVPR